MSLPDCQLEEPDYDICDEHEMFRPCRMCYLEHAEYQADCEREELGMPAKGTV